MAAVIWHHCAKIKFLDNVTPHNRSDKGLELNNDIQQQYDRSENYFWCNQLYQQVVALIHEEETNKYEKTTINPGGGDTAPLHWNKIARECDAAKSIR